jgi:hypothetical protein
MVKAGRRYALMPAPWVSVRAIEIIPDFFKNRSATP